MKYIRSLAAGLLLLIELLLRKRAGLLDPSVTMTLISATVLVLTCTLLLFAIRSPRRADLGVWLTITSVGVLISFDLLTSFGTDLRPLNLVVWGAVSLGMIAYCSMKMLRDLQW